MQGLVYSAFHCVCVDDIVHHRIILYTQSENQECCSLGPTIVFSRHAPLQHGLTHHPFALHLPSSHLATRELRHRITQDQNYPLEHDDVLRALYHRFPFRYSLDISSASSTACLVRLQASVLHH